MVQFLFPAALALLSASAVLAQTLAIATPPSLTECEPTAVSWSGGTAPYYITVIPGGQTTASPLETFPTQTGTSYTWTVDLAAGTLITFQIKDSTGLIEYSSEVTIAAGSTTSCTSSSAVVAGSSTASSAAASSAAASGSSGASSVASLASSKASSASSKASSAVSSASSVTSALTSSVATEASSVSSVASSSVTSSASTATSTAAKSGAGVLAGSSFLAVGVAALVAIAA